MSFPNPSPWPPTNYGSSNLLRQSYFIQYVDVSGPTTLRSDSSMNGNLFVSQTIYPTGGINQTSTINNYTVVADSTTAARLFVTNNTTLYGNLYAYGNTISNGDVSMNSRLFVNGDVSMNSRLFVTSDVSMGGRLFVGNDVFLKGRLNVYEYTNTNIVYTDVTTSNYSLVIAEDLSLNGRLFTSKDATISGINVGVGGGGNNTNVAIGLNSLANNLASTATINGWLNIAIGPNALSTNVYGWSNVAIGQNALNLVNSPNDLNAQGSKNVAIGVNAGNVISSGYQNTVFGSGSLSSNTIGYMNTAIGAFCGNNNITGNYNTYLGYNANANSNAIAYGNSTAIGVGSTITASNQIVLGTAAEYVNIPSTTVSNGTSSGALVVGGGVGISGSLNIGGNVASGQPQTWYITGAGSNGTTGGGGVYGASNSTSGAYFSSVTIYGGAVSSQWNTATGTFTVPSAGLYNILLCVFSNSPNTSGRTMIFVASGTSLSSQYCSFDNSALGEQTWEWGITLYFSSGGTFYFKNDGNSMVLYYNPFHTTLTITKIY